MLKNKMRLIALTMPALMLASCGDSEPEDDGLIAQEGRPAPAQTTAAVTAPAIPANTGDVLQNVEDPSLGETTTASANSTSENGGTVSAFGNRSAADGDIQSYRQQAQDVAQNNRRMEDGVTQATQR